jgi:hypothetical protein
MLKHALPLTFLIAVLLSGCGGNPAGAAGGSVDILGSDSCTTPLAGLTREGPSHMSLKVGETQRAAFNVGTPAGGCSGRAVGPFQRLTWTWSGNRAVDVRLVECRDCQVEYADRVDAHGAILIKGSALIHGEQAVVFDVTRLAPGVDVVGVAAYRDSEYGEYSSAFVQVDVAR